MRIPFVGPAYTLRSQALAAQQCVNFYIERSEVNPNEMALYGTPGTRRLLTLPNTGGIRQLYAPAIGKAIAVHGDKVYRVSGDWSYQQCPGTLLSQTGYVSIADNGTVAVLVDGLYGYVLDLATNVITRITSDAFYGADRVGFIDGYFIFNKPGTQQFYISSLYGTDFDGLDFASAEGSPDLLVSLLVDHREVWMFGDTTTEVFYNSGNPDFPIERLQGAFIEHGCAAKHSVAKLDNTVFWLGKDANGSGTIWRANGYTPQRVSTHAVEYALQSYSQISDAIAYTYQQDGHAFYVITFPQASKTWCLDVSNGAWHERSYRNTTTGRDERHRSSCFVYFGGTHLVGDHSDGRIYHLDPDYYTDDGDPLVSMRSCAVISNENKRLFHRALEIDVESGVGINVLVDPTIDIDVIDGDDIIASEDADDVTISGTTMGANDQTVTIMVDGDIVGTAVVSDGVWSASALDLTAYIDGGTHEVTADVADIHGNPAIQASRTVTIQFDSDASALFARMSTPPSNQWKQRIDDLIVELKASGYFQLMDSLYIPRTGETQQAALLDWRRSTKSAILNGSATWSAADGFVGSIAAGSYVDTDFTPSVDGVNLALNSGCIFAYIVTRPQISGGTGYVWGASGTAGNNNAIASDNPATGAVSYSLSNSALRTSANSKAGTGLLCIVRTSATTVTAYLNGVYIDTTSVATATSLCDRAIAILASRTSLIGSCSSGAIAAWGAGDAFSAAEQNDIKAIMDVYFAAA